MEGRLDTGKQDALVFIATHKPYIGERFAIPYASISAEAERSAQLLPHERASHLAERAIGRRD